MDLYLNGKSVFVTGAARGQGRAVALTFAQEGARVAGMDVGRSVSHSAYPLASDQDVANLHADFAKAGASLQLFQGDVSRPDEVQAAIEGASRANGPIDILVNCAGICEYADLDQCTPQQWSRMFEVNVSGCWHTTRSVLPSMKERRTGVVVNISSIAGIRALPRLPHYSVSKFAVTGLTQAIALEGAEYGIRAVSVHPGGVDTPMNDGLARSANIDPVAAGQRSFRHLLPRPYATAQEIANIVVFAASPRSSFVTGSALLVEGGAMLV